LLIPGTACALAERMTQPVFLLPPLPKDATPCALLSWGSMLLYGFSRSLRLRAKPQELNIEDNSLGVSCPFSAYRRRESTSLLTPPVAWPCQKSTPTIFGPGFRWWVPIHQLRSRSQAFSTSQRPSSSRLRPIIFGWVALLGLCPPGDQTSCKALTVRHCQHTLLTFFPSVALPLS
jgi:hypothetical protein